jgi:hypothetical protein
MPYYGGVAKMDREQERQKDYQATYLEKHNKVRTTVYLNRAIHKEARLESIRRGVGLSGLIEALLAAELGFGEVGYSNEQTGNE